MKILVIFVKNEICLKNFSEQSMLKGIYNLCNVLISPLYWVLEYNQTYFTVLLIKNIVRHLIL